MDFGIIGSDNNLGFSSNSKNGSFVEFSKQKMCGSGNHKQERTLINEEDELLREFKVAKTSDGHQQQMLSFSSPNSVTTLPLYHHTSSRNPGYGYGIGLRCAFTGSQWMELEHQALIYKYITANVPIPSYLLIPIRKALESSGFSTFSGNAPLGWGGFHLGFSNGSDPEPGRCRRTDGKKWRCSKDAVIDQKYCERHLNRGRNRSRKPVEQSQPQPKLPPMASPATSASLVASSGVLSNNLGLSYSHHQGTNSQPAGSSNHLSGIPNINRNLADKDTGGGAYQKTTPKDNHHTVSKQQNIGQEEYSSRQEFGFVCSDSLLNPLNMSSSVHQFMDNWPKSQSSRQNPTISWPDVDPQLSISIASSPLRLSREIEETQMGLGVGPVSWEPASIMGGPLGEVLHTTSEWKNSKAALNLMEKWDNNNINSPSLSPTRVLHGGGFGSLSNSSAGSSPRERCNGFVGHAM